MSIIQDNMQPVDSIKLEKENHQSIESLEEFLKSAKEKGATHFYVHPNMFKDADGDKNAIITYFLWSHK